MDSRADGRRPVLAWATLWCLVSLPACTIPGTDGGMEETSGTDTDVTAGDSPLVADCQLPPTGSHCGAIRHCSSGGSESESGSDSDEDCENGNDAVKRCVVGAAQAGVAFRYSHSSLTDGGQYGSVLGIVVREDGSRAETDSEYNDLCAEVRATLYGPADFSGCEDFECTEARFSSARRLSRCGPEDVCGI